MLYDKSEARRLAAAQRGEEAVPDLETDQLLTRLSHLVLEMDMHRRRLFDRQRAALSSG